MKPALLVIDVQKQFFSGSQAKIDSLNNAVETINAAVALFRACRLPVVYIQHKNEADGLVPGTEDFELPDAFDVQPEDIRITKTYGNSFNQTGLAEQLKALGVDAVLLTGYCAEWCVLSTYRGAEDLNLNPMILFGSLASGSEENLHFVEKLSEGITFEALKLFMKK